MTMTSVKTQGYSVQMIDQQPTPHGVYWCATLLHHTTCIGTVCNTGRGGQTTVRCNDPVQRAAYATAARHACPDSYEPESRFAELLADVADALATGA